MADKQSIREISWEEIDAAVRKVAKRIPKDKYRSIYGIPKGGLIPAVMMAHMLRLPLVLAPEDGCLIVDEIVDTGTTIEVYQNDWHKSKGIDIAALYVRYNTKCKPDYYAEDVMTMDWLKFPWEDDLNSWKATKTASECRDSDVTQWADTGMATGM